MTKSELFEQLGRSFKDEVVKEVTVEMYDFFKTPAPGVLVLEFESGLRLRVNAVLHYESGMYEPDGAKLSFEVE